MKKFFAFLGLISFFLLEFVSCGTTHLAIPGESAVIKNNISSEYYSIASSYENLKNYTKAIEYYTLAAKNKNLQLNCKYKIARCYALNKDWENAKTEYQKILSYDPENVNLQLSMAYIYAMSGDFKEALELYKELSEKNPSDYSILKNYISILISDSQFDEAKNKLAFMKENFPDQTETINSLEKALNDSMPKEENQEEKDLHPQNPPEKDTLENFDDFESEVPPKS